MFIQVIQSKSTRRDEVHQLMQEWRDLPGNDSSGWLGGTYGFTDDDEFIGVVRFESKEAAMANSARPETDAMAQKLAALMEGPPEFHDCDDVTEWMGGGSDDAGFVQIMRGNTDDPDRIKNMITEDTSDLQEARPDIMGGTLGIEADGTWTQTIYFTDEASAREGEKQGPPPERQAEMQAAFGDVTYYDLHDPWFESP
jgi:hypothetical protein